MRPELDGEMIERAERKKESSSPMKSMAVPPAPPVPMGPIGVGAFGISRDGAREKGGGGSRVVSSARWARRCRRWWRQPCFRYGGAVVMTKKRRRREEVRRGRQEGGVRPADVTTWKAGRAQVDSRQQPPPQDGPWVAEGGGGCRSWTLQAQKPSWTNCGSLGPARLPKTFVPGATLTVPIDTVNVPRRARRGPGDGNWRQHRVVPRVCHALKDADDEQSRVLAMTVQAGRSGSRPKGACRWDERESRRWTFSRLQFGDGVAGDDRRRRKQRGLCGRGRFCADGDERLYDQ